MSYKVEVRAIGESTFCASGVRLPDAEQAELHARELSSRWYGFDEYRIVESTDEVNCTADEHGRLTHIVKAKDENADESTDEVSK